LVMEQRRRRVMGVGQMQEVLQPGVAQTTVSFSAHRLLELAPEETQTRHQLQSRGFDQLLGLALARLTLAASLRDELEQQTRLLQAKIGLLQRSNWGFGSSAATPPPDLEELESDLEAIETVYAGLGGSTDYLARNLEIVTEMLEQPEQHLQLQATTLVMDRMGILRRQVENDAWEVPLQVLHIGEEGERVVALVEV